MTPTARSGATLALSAMLCVQLGIASSLVLVDDLGATGTAWLRLTWAAVFFLLLLAVVRKPPPRAALPACVALGVATALVTILFTIAVTRLPLGTASALEFLGPLAVAFFRSSDGKLVYPSLAALGVLFLTEPWHGTADLVGVAAALGAAACWAVYIVLTQHVGDSVTGLAGLTVSMPVAALVAFLVLLPQTDTTAFSGLSPRVLLIGAAIAILLPIVPFALEMVALRWMTAGAFGTLMCLEPAIALLIGLVVLHQVPGVVPLAGVMLVIAAGLGAERSGARTHPEDRPVIPAGATA